MSFTPARPTRQARAPLTWLKSGTPLGTAVRAANMAQRLICTGATQTERCSEQLTFDDPHADGFPVAAALPLLGVAAELLAGADVYTVTRGTLRPRESCG
ncbi:hypothetical protein ACTU45_12210 [Streptomyces sp. 24-1644]|uniref:hypothetical protein n=1 Tax=Streptomyces sp. 24-1644 TaxID=3457315 RepID=UPI003FA6A8AC